MTNYASIFLFTFTSILYQHKKMNHGCENVILLICICSTSMRTPKWGNYALCNCAIEVVQMITFRLIDLVYLSFIHYVVVTGI